MNRLVPQAVLAIVSFTLGGCGGAPSTTRPTTGPQGADAPGAVDTSLPADAPILATGRVAEVAPLFGALLMLFDSDRSRAIVEGLALDPARASGAAVYPGGAVLDALARRLGTLVPASPDATPAQGTHSRLAAAVAPGRDAPIHARLVVASTRPSSTFDALGAFLTEADFTKWPRTPAGFDGVFAQDADSFVLGLCHDDDDLVIEVLDFPFAAEPATQHDRARAELERLRGGSQRSTAPALALADGELAHVVVLPRAVSELHFVLGVGKTLSALGNVDPGMQDELARTGLFEAAGALALAGDTRGPYAERIEIAARGTLATLETTTRITLGPALAGTIAAGAPAQGTTFSPIDGAYAEASASVRAIPLPHRADAPDAPESFTRLMAESGGSAPYLYALPHVIVLVLRGLLDAASDPPIPPPIRAAAERIGTMFGDHDVRVALLPAGTTAVEAALALPRATGAPRPRMLSLDQVVGVGTASAMTVAVGDRFAVLVCENAELLRAAHVELTPASSAVGTATLSLVSINSVLGARGIALPASYRFALEATPTEWILRGSPGPASP